MGKRLALIHTSPVVVGAFAELAKEMLGDWRVFHMVDESLIQNTIAEGKMTPATARRVLELILSAEQGGADAAMVTCSSIGRAVTAARPFVGIPVLRIDEAMAAEAVSRGRRIGVAATLQTTLDPTLALLEATAQEAGKAIETAPCLCEGAFAAVVAGETARHDAMVREAVEKLARECDVVVLAQASMARAVSGRGEGGTPILSSPRLAMERARRELGIS
jgi:Asp/Glu/hydantoin racemase